MPGKWIQEMGLKKGALREELGIKKGEKIPMSRLEEIKSTLSAKAEKGELDKKESRLLKRVNLALTFHKMKK